MQRRDLVSKLLTWFESESRSLPWRHTRDPYAIWVSEIMLQQTQVTTVLPYWERWMQALPDIASLARAKPEKLHKLWEGLGYYTRVRNMQKAAKLIVTKHVGRFPRDFEEVLALPGIGRYTAGAICSIAFNQPKPILDGNVIRVLTRLYGIDGNPRKPKTNKKLWSLAEHLVSRAAGFRNKHATRTRSFISAGACSELNQSLMELGALICTPRQPKCDSCPISADCVAKRKGRVLQLPALGARLKPTRRHFVAFVAENRGSFLVRQRPEGVVNAHLWEFPNVEMTLNGNETNNKDRLMKMAETIVRVKPSKIEPLCTIRHSITRYRIVLDAYRVVARDFPNFASKDQCWLERRELCRRPFTAAHKRIVSLLV